MYSPTPDNIAPAERAPATEREPAVSVEREVRLQTGDARLDEIRARLRSGFYRDPEIAAVVARRIISRGDL